MRRGSTVLFSGVLVSCAWRLDLGSRPDEDGGASSAADAGEASPTLRRGLYVDGVECSITDNGGGGQWKGWSISVQAYCPAYGKISFTVTSYADIPYPQTCSVATSVSAAINEGDAWVASWGAAGGSYGSCTVVSGPTERVPTTGLAFTATVAHYYDHSKTHTIEYRAEDAP